MQSSRAPAHRLAAYRTAQVNTHAHGTQAVRQQLDSRPGGRPPPQKRLSQKKDGANLAPPRIHIYKVVQPRLRHSCRRAIIGSTPAARLAGNQHATSATPTSPTATTAIVTGSNGLTPKSSVCISRVSSNAAADPIATPSTANLTPCPTIIPSTSRSSAPRAMRIPISFVRCVTEYEITPNTPTAASTSAITPNAPTSINVNRVDEIASALTVASGLTFSTGKSASSAATSRGIAAANGRQSPAVFSVMKRSPPPTICQSLK